MKIHIGTDHSGFAFKNELVEYLKAQGHETVDHGAHELDPKDDYPDFVMPAAKAVNDDSSTRGIVIGGSGQGEAFAANKYTNVRAVVFYGGRSALGAVDVTGRTSDDPFEIIRLTRLHNDSNVLSFGVRFVSIDEAKQAVDIWLSTEFEGGRHQARIDKIIAAAA